MGSAYLNVLHKIPKFFFVFSAYHYSSIKLPIFGLLFVVAIVFFKLLQLLVIIDISIQNELSQQST